MRLKIKQLDVPMHTGAGDSSPADSERMPPMGRPSVGDVQRRVDEFATRSSSIDRGLPGRSSSYRPLMRRSTKRRRHLPIIALV